MANYKKLGKNIFSLTIGSFASKLLAFLFVPFYTAVLSTEEYGTADLITTTVSLLFPFFTCIICEAMLRFAQDKNESQEDIYTIGMMVWGIGFLVLLVISPIFLLIPSLKNYLFLILLYYVAYSLHSNIGYFVRGIQKVTIFSISGIINTLCAILLNLLFLLVIKMGVEGYMLAYIIAHFVSAVFMFFAARLYRYKVSIKRINRDLFNRMMKFSIPLIPNSASWWVSNSSDKYILTFFAGVGVNGIYSVAYKIPTIISMVTGIFNTAWRLSAVEKFGTEESRKFYSNVFDMFITITVEMASCLMLVNKPLSHLLYSNDFYQAWQFVPILLVAAILQSYSDFYGTMYTSVYKTQILFYSTLAGAVANIVLNFILIPKFSAIGAAVATMLSYLLVFVIRIVDSRKIMRLSYNLVNDFCCVFLILVQLIFSCTTLKYEYLISGICFVILFLLRVKNMKGLVEMVLHKKKRNDSSVETTEIKNDLDQFKDIKAYSGFYKDNTMLLRVASGGAASVLAEAILSRGGVVYGAGYEIGFKSVKYYRLSDVNDLPFIQGSKYVASTKKVIVDGVEHNIYSAISNDLQKGLSVLFTGLGCDVGAVKRYCEIHNIPTERLFTVDLICQGPTFKEAQKSYVEYLEKKYNSQISMFSMRYKKQGWEPPYIHAEFKNGKIFEQKWTESELFYAFARFANPSCGNCKFKGKNHQSDITVGDYWGLKSGMASYNRNGVSVLLVNTIKGDRLVSMIDQSIFELKEADSVDIIRNNPMYYLPRKIADGSKNFEVNLKEKGLHYAIQKNRGFLKAIYCSFYHIVNNPYKK